MNLKKLLLNREYSERTIDAAINRARQIPRHIALRRARRKTENRRPVFALTYDPRLPDIQSIQAKHWRSMVSQDPYLSEVFHSHLLQHIRGRGISETTLLEPRFPQTLNYTLREDRGG